MRHVNYGWKWETEPFPRLRSQAQFGKHKHFSTFLPALGGVEPVVDERSGNAGFTEHGFSLIKSRKKGTFLIIPEPDTTPRLLLTTEEEGGFRGGVRIVEEATTAFVFLQGSAESACESKLGIAALFEPGQRVVIYSWGRGERSYAVYTWDGSEIRRQAYTEAEWEHVSAPVSTEDAETL